MNPTSLEATFPKGITFPIELADLCRWTEENGYPISGGFELRAGDGESIQCWFGHNRVSDRFGIFGAGPDGSLYAVWKQDDGRQPIVHLGSEGQNNFVLAESFREFLRLLAIGYDEIGFDDLSSPPANSDDINPDFQRWVVSRYSVTIPDHGIEITQPAGNSHSDFQAWIDQNL